MDPARTIYFWVTHRFFPPGKPLVSMIGIRTALTPTNGERILFSLSLELRVRGGGGGGGVPLLSLFEK